MFVSRLVLSLSLVLAATPAAADCPSDLDLLFDRNLDQKYDRALSKLGIDPSHLVSEAGHA